MRFGAEMVQEMTSMTWHCAANESSPSSAMSGKPVGLRGIGCSGLPLLVRGYWAGALAPILRLVPIPFVVCSGARLPRLATIAAALL